MASGSLTGHLRPRHYLTEHGSAVLKRMQLGNTGLPRLAWPKEERK